MGLLPSAFQALAVATGPLLQLKHPQIIPSQQFCSILLVVKHSKIILFGIILFAIFLRFYNGPYRYGVGDDASRDAFVAYVGADQFQFPLTGPFSSLGPFTFGPWYYYQIIIFTLLTGSPWAPWIYLGIASTAFVFVMYLIGKKIYNTNFGLIVALLAAISAPQVSSAKNLTNPNLIPIFAGLTVLIFLKFTTEQLRSYWWGFIWGLIIGIGINIHYQMSGLLLFIPILFIYKRGLYKQIFCTMIGIFISFIPLLIFDLNNHWYTLRNLSYYYLHGKEVYYVPNRWLFYLRDFWPEFWSFTLGIPKIIGITLAIGSGLTIVWFLTKKLLPKPFILLLIAFGLNFLILRYYWGQRYMGYLQFLHPFIFLFSAFPIFTLINNRATKLVGFIVLLTTIGFILPITWRELPPDYPNSVARKEVEIIKNTFPGKEIGFYNCKNQRWSHTIAAVFMLNLNHVLSDNSEIKLGFLELDADFKCDYPPSDKFDPNSLLSKDQQYDLLYPLLPNTKIINFSEASPAALKLTGWGEPITPEKIFENTVRWWFREQP